MDHQRVHLWMLQTSSFDSLVVWTIQVCVNILSSRTDISNHLRKAVVAAHQSERGYKVISKQFGVHHSTVLKIIHMWKIFETVANLIPAGSPQGQTAQCSEKSWKKKNTSQTLQASVSMLNVKVHGKRFRQTRLSRKNMADQSLQSDIWLS